MAAVLASARVFEAFWSDDAEDALMHGPTYMANPLACAAANASLDLFDSEPRLKQVAAIEAHLKDALAPCRGEVKGAIGAIRVRDPDITWMKERFIEEGVWLRPFGDVVYCMPPFTISERELAQVTGAMVRVVQQAHGRN
jgi:adenosylmethionine-8-amino-7-oxononanoate aminotransferase